MSPPHAERYTADAGARMMRASAATTTVLLMVGMNTASAEQSSPTLLAPPSSNEHPLWEPSWQMNQSTIIMPCNQSGYTTAKNVSKFAIVDYDVRPTTATAAMSAALLTALLCSGTTQKRFGQLPQR
jgi:hypothetical protein